MDASNEATPAGTGVSTFTHQSKLKTNHTVELRKNKPTTTSLVIAAGVERSHKGLLQTIEKHADALQEVGGTFAFQMRKSRGKETRFAVLNEEHCTYLMTTFRDSPIVRKFKVALVREFYRMRKQLMDISIQQQNSGWLDARHQGKSVRYDQTDTIKAFVSYASDQGSGNADRYYMAITKMENRSLFLLEQNYPNLRNVLNARQLGMLAAADQVIEQALLDGMKQRLPYKAIFQLAKDRVCALVEAVGISPVPEFNKLPVNDCHSLVEAA